MKITTALASTLLASICACGGDSGQSWPDAFSAIYAGGQAKAAGDNSTAVIAYRFAAENAAGNQRALCSALLGLGEAQCKDDPEAAISAFNRAATDGGSAYNFAASQRVIDAWLNAGVVELAEAAIEDAATRFSADADKLEVQRKALAAIKSGDTEALSALGYVGD